MHVLSSLIFSALSLSAGCEPDVVRIGTLTYDRACLELSEGQSAMTLLDANGDGHLDLAVVNESFDELVLFAGDGKGTFTRMGRTNAGENPTSVMAGDVSGDGHDDLVIANHETTYLTLLNGDGTGAFAAAENSPLQVPVAPHPHMAGLKDMNQDGRPDILIDHRNGAGILVLAGLGAGQFASEGRLINVGGDPYRGFAIGDVNGDQLPDIVTPNPSEIGVILQAQDGEMTFQQPVFLASSSPFAVDLADFNGDDRLDMVAASAGSRQSVQLFLQSAEGHLVEAAFSPFDMAGGAKQIVVGDLNADGYDDALIGCWNQEVLMLLGGKGPVQALPLHDVGTPWGMVAGDLNGDGRDDFIVADGEHSAARVFLSKAD
ncbi:MAG: VCBS repeat-containing protein [Bacteroidota bacterium]